MVVVCRSKLILDYYLTVAIEILGEYVKTEVDYSCLSCRKFELHVEHLAEVGNVRGKPRSEVSSLVWPCDARI